MNRQKYPISKGLVIRKGPNRLRSMRFLPWQRRVIRQGFSISEEERTELNRIGMALKQNPIVKALLAGQPLPPEFFIQ